MKRKISIQILTKNAENTLHATLQSVVEFPEVILLDTGSTDTTLSIATKFSNVRVYCVEFKGFGLLHNEAAALASYDWILSIDSDEQLSTELKQEILNLSLENERSVYSMRRNNFFNKKRIRCCSGWHPDWVVRLYHRKKTKFSDDLVHEKILTEGMHLVSLRASLEHYPYNSISDFLNKMEKYSSLFAHQYRNTKRSSLSIALLHSLAAFFKNYILKRGIFGGKEGFIISLYNAQMTYYKYIKLAELNESF